MFVILKTADNLLSGDKIQAYGKAAIVGLNGEIEHASAFIHTLRFGNKFRDAVGGTSYLSFTNTRGPAGSKISIHIIDFLRKKQDAENDFPQQNHKNEFVF